MRSCNNYNFKILDIRKEIATLQKEILDETKVNNMKSKLHSMEAKLENTCNKHKKDLKFFETYDDCPTCQQAIDAAFKATMIDKKKEKVAELKKVEEELKKVEEKASKPDTLTIEVPDKGTFKKVDTDVDIKKVGEYGEKIIEVYKDIALPAIKTVDDLNSYYKREEATLQNLKQNAVDVYDKIIDLFKQRKEKING